MDDKPKPRTTRRRCVDLGIITVVTNGIKDTVFLTHNGELVFSMLCVAKRPSQITFSEKLYAYSGAQWLKIFTSYTNWKRKEQPNFKLPRFSGATRDGHAHPWSWHPPRPKPPPQGYES